MKANFNIAKNVRNSHSINALSALRKLQSLGLLLCALMIGSLQVWGAVGDLVTSVTPTSDLASGTTYQAETGTDWAVNVTNNSAFGTNAKSGNDGKLMLSNNSDTDSRNTAIASALASYTGSTFTDETQYVAALIGLSSISNVAKVGVTYTGTNGGNPGDMWVLYTTNSGTSYTVAGHTSSVSSGTNITFSTIASAQYAVVFKRTAAFGLKGATISFYEGAAAGFIVTINKNNNSYGNVSASSVTGVTSGTSISASGNVLSVGATNVTATPNSGYKFNNWTGIPGGGTVTGNVTVTANFAAVSYSNYRTLCSTTDPSITVSPASITNLDYIVGQGPSAAQNITLGGSNLTASITITAPTNFEVSTDGGSTYGDSRTVTQTGGVPDVSTVKVRLKAGLAVNTYGSANVTFASTGATTQNVAVTGHVLKPTITATPNPVSWSTAVGVAPSPTSVTVTGSNLKANITAVKGGTNASDFTISPASITQTSGSASGSITITYTEAYNAVTTKTATLTLSSTDADDVVVNITFNVVTDPNLYFLTDLEDIGPKDKVIIVSSKDIGGVGEVDYALANATVTKAPDAVDVKSMISGNRQTLTYSGTDLQWNINYNSVSHKLVINRDGDDDVFLALKNDNNGVQVGNYAYKTFQVVSDGVGDGYLFNVDLSTYGSSDRVMGVYNNDDWRCYGYTPGTSASIHANISDQTFTYYAQPSTDPYVTLGASFTEFTYEYNHGPSTPQSFTISGANLSENLIVTAPSNYQVCKTIDGTYTNSVSFTPSTGTVSEQTVYIRLVAGLAVGEYDYAQSGGLSVTSTGADAVKAALEGSVTPESFTVTATSSNVSHGTVSPASQSTTTNMTITASPVDGYRVVSGAGGYTVTAGTASVTNNGDNTFTVTPSTDCTVRINFEAIPTHKVTYWATGTKVQETDVREGAAIPDQTTETAVEIEAYCSNREHFVGWTANSTYSDATDAPADLITTMSPGGTMSTSDVNYYAVFANTGGVGSTSFSRVTSLSQLADGDVIAIVAEQSGGQIFGTSADHKGGAAPSETDGKITVSASTNQWTLEASSSDWKLHKGDNYADILCADLTYTAYGNAMSIVDAKTSNYFFIKSSSKALEYYSSNWQFYSISNPATDAQNGNVRLKIYKQDAGFVDYTTQCCSLQPVTDVVVNSMTNTSVTLGWTLPASTAGITKFQVIDVDNGNAVVKDNISTSATNSGSISGLTKCNTYHYKVVSYSSTCTVTSSAIEFRPFGDAHTVNFNYNGGTGTPASFTTSCDGTSTTLPTPDARDGYTFLGWWSASSGGDKRGDAGDSYTVTGNTTIWAHWAQNFTVTYNRRGGTIVCGGSEIGVAGQTFTICTTEPTRSGYIFAGWDTEEGGTGTRYNAGGTFTMPSSDVTLYAQWTANWRNLTFNVPEGGGSATGVPSGSHVLDGQSFTMPTITGKSDSKWCWTFLGWTETAPNGSGRWDVTPSYIAGGATSGAITSDKVYYAVYSKTGAGASGDVSLSNSTIVAKWTGAGNTYGTLTTLTEDAKTWNYTGFGQSGNSFLQLKDGEAYYLQTPVVGGSITSITVNYTAVSSDSRTVYFNTSASKTSAVTYTFDGTYTSGNHDLVVDVSSLDATSIYILANNTFKINSVSFHFGPPAVYGYTLDDCPCVVEEFDLTYDANATNFPGSTTTCTGVTDYRWEDHENEYTICSTEPTLESYKFTHWATNANGSGTTYDAGEVITCVGETPITLYAQYERVYTVTFNNQGVTTPVTQASEGATIAVPSATSPCSAEWAFVGWSETAIAPMSMLPSIEIASGTSTYTPTADKTLYAIYRKTSESSPFVAGMSGAYKISNGSTVYAGACNNSKLPETDAAGAAVFYIKYTSADGGKYTIQQADGKYLKYSGSSTGLALNDAATPYYWTMTQNGSLWHVLGVGSGRYLQYSSGTGFKAYNTSGPTDIAFVTAEGQYYYRTMSCASDYDITFHDNGTTINWAVGHPEASYKDLADATVVSTFPTATFDGWTFLGWRRSDYAESTDAPASSGIFGGSDGTSGNTLTIASANEDLYPVFTRFEDNEPFDQINGGDYFIYYLAPGTNDGYGGAKRVYAATYDGEKRYNSTTLCEEATTFTFEKLANGKWTIYDNTTNKYLADKADNWLCQQNAPAEWTITVASGNQFDAYSTHSDYHIIAYDYGGGASTAIFQNYSAGNLTTDPTQYHRVYLGSCTNRTFTTNPSTTPHITMNGAVAPITSSQNGAVRATNVLSVSGGNLTPSTGEITITSNNSDVYFSLSTDKNFAKGVADQPKASVTITANGSGVVTPTPVYIHYKPSSNTDTWTSVTVTASYPGAVSQTATIELRIVKENFAIAAKVAGSWYALPADKSAEGVFEPVLIDVDESAKIAYGPTTVGYKMWPVQTVNGGTDEYTTNGDKVRFAGNSNAGLWASNSNNKIRNWATITAIGSTAETPASYEWIIETEDRNTYTLKSMYSTNYLDLYRPSSGGNAGKLVWASNSTYETNEIHFFPLTEREVITIIPREWKTNGLVFSVAADNQITAVSYKIGTGSETSTTYTRHSTGGYGLYEVALPDLTSQYGKLLTLKLTISGTPTYATTTIPIIVNANASTKTNEPFATLGAATKDYDVVVLDGKTLTTDAIASGACKFQNLYIYPGATLVNAANNNLSVRYLELRGGIKGIDHKSDLAQGVPHLKLEKNFSSTAGANLDMCVNTAHSYALSVPFDVTLSTVNFANSLNTETSEPINGTLDAQFMIMEYDGAQRASTGKGWKHITSTERVLHAGEGYVLQGKRPKGQPFAVIRFPFSSVTGWADGSGEVTKEAVSIYEYAGGANTPDNDKGWNLIANPYMATLSYSGADEGWAADFTVGSLVKTDTDPWDGKYEWTSTTNAYVTIPNEWYSEFPQYRANSAQAVFEPFKNFFIQASADGSVSFDKSKRAFAPRHILAQIAKVQPIYADINLTHGEAFAQAGLTIDENATAGYKFGEDQNIFENREALTYLKVYTVADGHYLVGNTMTPAETEELIPVEFYAPNAEGEYVFSLDDNSDIDRLEYVILYDAELGLNTNLLTNDYTVELEQTGLIENRFSIGLKIKKKEDSATGVDNVNSDNERPFKFIFQEKMYILRGGKLYDATGKLVQ